MATATSKRVRFLEPEEQLFVPEVEPRVETEDGEEEIEGEDRGGSTPESLGSSVGGVEEILSMALRVINRQQLEKLSTEGRFILDTQHMLVYTYQVKSTVIGPTAA